MVLDMENSYRVNTPGPGFIRQGSTAREVAERDVAPYMPLKRGWTLEINDVAHLADAVHLVRRNSKGAVVPNGGAIVYRQGDDGKGIAR